MTNTRRVPKKDSQAQGVPIGMVPEEGSLFERLGMWGRQSRYANRVGEILRFFDDSDLVIVVFWVMTLKSQLVVAEQVWNEIEIDAGDGGGDVLLPFQNHLMNGGTFEVLVKVVDDLVVVNETSNWIVNAADDDRQNQSANEVVVLDLQLDWNAVDCCCCHSHHQQPDVEHDQIDQLQVSLLVVELVLKTSMEDCDLVVQPQHRHPNRDLEVQYFVRRLLIVAVSFRDHLQNNPKRRRTRHQCPWTFYASASRRTFSSSFSI